MPEQPEPPEAADPPRAPHAATPPPSRTTWLIRVGAIASLVIVLVLVIHAIVETQSPTSAGTSVTPAQLVVGDRAPTGFQLRELGSSRSESLGQLFAGHAVVVNFFASWCTACAEEMSNFATVAKSSPRSVAFVGIDTNETDPARMRTILDNAHVPYPVLSDTDNLTVAGAFGITDLPTTFFITASGKVTAEVLGYESAAKLTHEVKLLLDHTT